MWMGTHSNNPSYDYETKRSLEDFIKDNQALMGNDVSKKYGEKMSSPSSKKQYLSSGSST